MVYIPDAGMITMEVSVAPLVKVSKKGGYNAFTGLACWNGWYWVAYRKGSGHVSPEGEIIVRRSQDGLQWVDACSISRNNLDLRDPRLAVLSGKLYVMYFTLDHYAPGQRSFAIKGSAIHEISRDGNALEGKPIKTPLDPVIPWSVGIFQGQYYISAYRLVDGHFGLHVLTASSLSGPWAVVSKVQDEMLPPNLGFNEADMVVDRTGGIMTLFCRIDKDSINKLRKGWRYWWQAKRARRKRRKARDIPIHRGPSNWFAVATAKPPYIEWDVKTYRLRLKGPRAIQVMKNEHSSDRDMQDAFLLVCRHIHQGNRRKDVSLFLYNEDILEKLAVLATGRDVSYAGLAWDEKSDDLLVSFYSDHEHVGTQDEGKLNDAWFTRMSIDWNDGPLAFDGNEKRKDTSLLTEYEK